MLIQAGVPDRWRGQVWSVLHKSESHPHNREQQAKRYRQLVQESPRSSTGSQNLEDFNQSSEAHKSQVSAISATSAAVCLCSYCICGCCPGAICNPGYDSIELSTCM
jgi:hypothetical protein